MEFSKLSDNGLKSFHLSVQKAAEADANNPNRQDPYYGVKDFADWAEYRDQIESELSRRKIPFNPVTW